MKYTFEFKVKVAQLAREKGVDIAREVYKIESPTVETWLDMYTGDNLYRNACKYAVKHGIDETAKILGVSARTFYRIRQKYGKRGEKKDGRRKVKKSFQRKVAEMSMQIGNKETAKALGTNVDVVYRARKENSVTSPNKKNNIFWEFVTESGYKSNELCEYCGVPRTAITNFTRRTVNPQYRKFVVALFAYKMRKLNLIDNDLFKKYWDRCRVAEKSSTH